MTANHASLEGDFQPICIHAQTQDIYRRTVRPRDPSQYKGRVLTTTKAR